MWSNTVLDVSMRIFLDEIDFYFKMFMLGCVQSKLQHLGPSLHRAGSFTAAQTPVSLPQ